MLHRAHQRLRNASQALEALVATDPIRGRWAPAPAPAEALQGARAELKKAYDALDRRHDELVDWNDAEPPGPERPAERETGPGGGSGPYRP